MSLYFSTFISGFSELVSESLQKLLPDFEQSSLIDGLIIYRTSAQPNEVARLRFLNNTFLLSGITQVSNTSGSTTLAEAAKVLISDLHLVHPTFPKSEQKTFRIVFSDENHLVSIERNIHKKLEEKIAKTLKMIVDRAKPDWEYWFLKRREGFVLFGLRLTRHPDYKDVLQKGELRPELANLLCLLSEPDKDDVFLDPFSGSGSIPRERTKFPYKKIISGDIKPALIKKTKGIEITKLDALYTNLPSSSINKVVTDPPWGVEVGKELDLPDFYSKMLKEFSRIMKPHGIVVILMGKKEIFEEILQQFPQFSLLKKYDILVSGKKAGVYKLVLLYSYPIFQTQNFGQG